MPFKKIRIRTPIRINGINPYVLIGRAHANRLKPDWRRPVPVRIQVNGKPEPPWRINLMPAGDGSFYLYLHGLVRKASGTSVGDIVDVTIEFDDAYKGGPAEPMPTWFESALKKNRTALKRWRDLTPSRKKEIVRYLARLKSPEAQQRNLQRALHVLAGGKARFMARTWN